MTRIRTCLLFLALLSTLTAVAPAANASHPSCSLLGPASTVTTPPVSVTAPIPSTLGPTTVPGATVGGQTVGGQTVGPATVPPIGNVTGVPVVGTIPIGGQSVGPFVVPTQTLPSHTVPPTTVGPIPTGLGPITVNIFSQTVTVPGSVNVPCTISTAFHYLNEPDRVVNCIIFNIEDEGIFGVIDIVGGECDPRLA